MKVNAQPLNLLVGITVTLMILKQYPGLLDILVHLFIISECLLPAPALFPMTIGHGSSRILRTWLIKTFIGAYALI